MPKDNDSSLNVFQQLSTDSIFIYEKTPYILFRMDFNGVNVLIDGKCEWGVSQVRWIMRTFMKYKMCTCLHYNYTRSSTSALKLGKNTQRYFSPFLPWNSAKQSVFHSVGCLVGSVCYWHNNFSSFSFSFCITEMKSFIHAVMSHIWI